MPNTKVLLPPVAPELDWDALLLLLEEHPAMSRAAAVEPTASAIAPRRFGFFINPPSDG
jgi:hypothetical protein